jgi:radical SAM protein with 4Fe4S-binding SPASM domain
MKNLTSNLHQDYSYFAFGKWFYYPERVACVRKGNFRDVMPVTVQLIPSLYCNFSCPRCCYGGSKENIKALGERKAMLMDADTMAAIIDRLSDSGIKGIVFTGGGEPTLNAHLIDGMRYAVQKGIKAGLFTNGSLLTETKIFQLLELEPTFIRVSLDAGTLEVHRLLHGYTDKHNYFPKVLENIERLAKGKLHRKANTTIGIGVTVEPVNLNDLVEVAKRLCEIVSRSPRGGVDYLAFRPTVNYQGGKSFRAAQPVLDYLKKKAPEYYEAYYDFMHRWKQLPTQLFEEANQVITGEVSQLLSDTGIQLINIRTKMLGITQPNRPFRKCRASPWYIFIGPDGTVYSCVDLGLDPRVAIGNLLTQSLSEIWESPRRQEVMDFIDNDGLHTLCPPVCVNYELNSLFEKLDEAIQVAGSQRHEALEWIDEQEAHVQTEIADGVYSQPHREFI